MLDNQLYCTYYTSYIVASIFAYNAFRERCVLGKRNGNCIYICSEDICTYVHVYVANRGWVYFRECTIQLGQKAFATWEFTKCHDQFSS